MDVTRRSLSLLAVVVVALAALAGCDPAARRLGGQVLDGGTTPVAGVTVEVFADDAETLVATAVTGGGGHFRFGDDVLVDGVDYRVRANGDTWYGGTDWASATSVTAGETTTIDIDIAFDPATISGTFTYTDFGTVVLHNTAGGSPRTIELDPDTGTAFEFTGVAPGTYQLEYQNRYFPSGSIQNRTAPFAVSAGATIVRNDPFPAVSSTLVWGTDGAHELPYDQSLGRWFVIDATTGDVISEASWRMAGDRIVRYFADRDVRVYGLAPSGEYRSQFLGATAANPLGTVFNASNPLSAVSQFQFTGRDCDPNVYLPGMDLRSTDLSGKILINCDLRDVNLSGVALPATANLLHADLSGADLTGFELHRGLGAVGLDGVDATGTQLSGFETWGGSAIGAVFDDADLSSGWLWWTDLTDASLVNADLAGITIEDTPATGADFTGADLTDARVLKSDVTGADFSGANLLGAQLWMVTGLDAAIYDNTTCPNGSVVTSPAVCTP